MKSTVIGVLLASMTLTAGCIGGPNNGSPQEAPSDNSGPVITLHNEQKQSAETSVSVSKNNSTVVNTTYILDANERLDISLDEGRGAYNITASSENKQFTYTWQYHGAELITIDVGPTEITAAEAVE